MSLKRNYLLALELVTFSHTLFILPLILSGYFIAYKNILLLDIFLIILAAISARTIGMLFNRIIDNEIDFQNPRTSSRPLPSGRASKNFVLLLLFPCTNQCTNQSILFRPSFFFHQIFTFLIPLIR